MAKKLNTYTLKVGSTADVDTEVGVLSIDMNDTKLPNTADGTLPKDAINKSQLDAAVTSIYRSRGNLDASGSATQLDNAKAGDVWLVSVAGTIVGEPLVKDEQVTCNTTVVGTPVDFSSFSANLVNLDNNLTGTDPTRGLASPQGKVLNDKIIEAIKVKGFLDASGSPTQLDNIKALDAYVVFTPGTFLTAELKAKDLLVAFADVSGTPTDLTNFGIYRDFADLLNITDIANNLTTTVAGKVLDATQAKILDDNKLNISNKATGAEVDTGTDDSKYITPKAITDSNILNSTDIVDNLTSSDASKALSSKMGKKLEDEKAFASEFLRNLFIYEDAANVAGIASCLTSAWDDTYTFKNRDVYTTTINITTVPFFPIAIKFTGYLALVDAEDYQFRTTSDDGSVLFLDGAIVVNNDGLHAPTTVTSAVISYTENKIVKFELRFFDAGGGAVLLLEYKKGTDAWAEIPVNLTKHSLSDLNVIDGFESNSKVDPGTAGNDKILKETNDDMARGEVLRQKYQEQVVMFGILPPLQWISANHPGGIGTYPTSYPHTVSTVVDIMPGSSNTYTIDLNAGAALTVIKDGNNGNAFHFTGNQSLYTTSNTISTSFTMIVLVRKPTLNNGRLITGFIDALTNNLLAYWMDKSDAWHIQTNGKLDVANTTDFLLYVFTNDNGTKEMTRYNGPGLATLVQASTAIGGNNWGRVVYGRPLAFSTENATNAYIYDSMIFNRVLSPAEQIQIVSFYQGIYPYY